MIPAPFEYRRAASVDEALDLLAEAGDEARLLAGGHSLLPLMRLRLARPSTLVDIGRVDELSYIREDDGHLALGALTRHHDVQHSSLLRERCPLLAHTAGLVGDPQVRHRGTLGGSVAHGDPASDPPAALLALDAEFVLRGPGGERTVPAEEFFVGPFMTALAPGEILVEIRVPAPPEGHGWSYVKFHRRAQDWAIVGVAAVVEADGDVVSRGAVGLTNMDAVPRRADAVEEGLPGTGRDALGSLADRADEGADPPDEAQASADYRRHLSRVLTRRALEEALGRAS